MSKKIYLAPSNQTSNSYAYGKTTEGVQCQAIAEKVKALLANYDCECRIGEASKTIQVKAKECNEWGANCYLSIHSNAGGGRGTEVWYNPDKKGSKDFATVIYNKIAAISPGKDRGLKSSTAYLDVNQPEVPCCLCEMEFHDWTDGAQWIVENKDKIAQTFVEGLVQYLSLTKKATQKATTTTTTKTSSTTTTKSAIKAGDVVKIIKGATYYDGKTAVPTWVSNKAWIVSLVSGDRVVINKSEDGLNAINSPINAKFLTVIKAASATKATTTATKTTTTTTANNGTIKVGSTVKLKQGALTYDGKKLSSFVYNRKHKVKEIAGQRVVITYLGIVVAAVKLSDLTLA